MMALTRGCRAGLLAALIAAASVHGQAQTSAPGTTATPRDTAPFDLTGYWTAVVTEDWRWRMVTPQKGDYASVPLNAKGRACRRVGPESPGPGLQGVRCAGPDADAAASSHFVGRQPHAQDRDGSRQADPAAPLRRAGAPPGGAVLAGPFDSELGRQSRRTLRVRHRHAGALTCDGDDDGPR